MIAPQIEIAVARQFSYRRNLVVPNVSWGFGLTYEADLVVVRQSGWACEVEIKTSAADIKADARKRKWRRGPWPCKYFREFWFAVPEKLAEHPAIPPHAGIISVRPDAGADIWAVPNIARRSKINPDAVKMLPEHIDCLRDLAAMRIWNLKAALHRKRFLLPEDRRGKAAA